MAKPAFEIDDLIRVTIEESGLPEDGSPAILPFVDFCRRGKIVPASGEFEVNEESLTSYFACTDEQRIREWFEKQGIHEGTT